MSKYEYLVSGLRDDAPDQRRFCVHIVEACVQRQNGVKHENMDKKGGKISPKEADIKSFQLTLLAVNVRWTRPASGERVRVSASAAEP